MIYSRDEMPPIESGTGDEAGRVGASMESRGCSPCQEGISCCRPERGLKDARRRGDSQRRRQNLADRQVRCFSAAQYVIEALPVLQVSTEDCAKSSCTMDVFFLGPQSILCGWRWRTTMLSWRIYLASMLTQGGGGGPLFEGALAVRRVALM